MQGRWTKHGRVKGTGEYGYLLSLRLPTTMHNRLVLMAEEGETTVAAVARRALAKEIQQWATEMEQQQKEIAV
jgi:hypothetical protein